jgi:hypothetical protein
MTTQTTQTYRASIIGIGKQSGKSDCKFITAVSKEAAQKYILSVLKENGLDNGSFKIDILPSSKEEIDFFMQNRYRGGYYGIVN